MVHQAGVNVYVNVNVNSSAHIFNTNAEMPSGPVACEQWNFFLKSMKSLPVEMFSRTLLHSTKKSCVSNLLLKRSLFLNACYLLLIQFLTSLVLKGILCGDTQPPTSRSFCKQLLKQPNNHTNTKIQYLTGIQVARKALPFSTPAVLKHVPR